MIKTDSTDIWDPLSTPALLTKDGIHILLLDFSSALPVNLDSGWLSEPELARYSAFKQSDNATRYLSSRYQLRVILAAYLGCAPEKIALDTHPGGKPFIDQPDTKLQFNLSHTGDAGLLALSPNLSVGVDLEKTRTVVNLEKIAARIFSAKDMEQLNHTDKARHADRFFTLWTLMEARQKTLGMGVFDHKLNNKDVGSQSVPLDAGYHAAVAWDNPSLKPEIRIFTYA